MSIIIDGNRSQQIFITDGTNQMGNPLLYSINSADASLLNSFDIYKDFLVSGFTKSSPNFDKLDGFLQTYLDQRASSVSYTNQIHNYQDRALHDGETITLELKGDRTPTNFIQGIKYFVPECGAGKEKILLYPDQARALYTASQDADEGPAGGDMIWPWHSGVSLSVKSNCMEILGLNTSSRVGVGNPNPGFSVMNWEAKHNGTFFELTITIRLPNDISVDQVGYLIKQFFTRQRGYNKVLPQGNLNINRDDSGNINGELVNDRNVFMKADYYRANNLLVLSGNAIYFSVSNNIKNNYITNEDFYLYGALLVLLKELGDTMQNVTYFSFCLMVLNNQIDCKLHECLMSTCDYTVHLRNMLVGLPSNYMSQTGGEEENNTKRGVGTLFTPTNNNISEDDRRKFIFEGELNQILLSNITQQKLLEAAIMPTTTIPFVLDSRVNRNRSSPRHPSISRINVKDNNIWQHIIVLINQLSDHLNGVRTDSFDLDTLKFFRIINFVRAGSYKDPNGGTHKINKLVISDITDALMQNINANISYNTQLTQLFQTLSDIYNTLHQFNNIEQGGGAGGEAFMSPDLPETEESLAYSLYIDVIYRLHMNKFTDKNLVQRDGIAGLNTNYFIYKAVCEALNFPQGQCPNPTGLKDLLPNFLHRFNELINSDTGIMGMQIGGIQTQPPGLGRIGLEHDEVFIIQLIQHVYGFIKQNERAQLKTKELSFPGSSTFDDGSGAVSHFLQPHQNQYQVYQQPIPAGEAGAVYYGGSSKLSKKKKRKHNVKKGKKSVKKQKAKGKTTNKKKVKRVVKRKYSSKKKNKN